jgi:hypothetical protein
MTGQVESWVPDVRTLGAIVMPADGLDASVDLVNESTGAKVITNITVSTPTYSVADTSVTVTDTSATAVDTDETTIDVYP